MQLQTGGDGRLNCHTLWNIQQGIAVEKLTCDFCTLLWDSAARPNGGAKDAPCDAPTTRRTVRGTFVRISVTRSGCYEKAQSDRQRREREHSFRCTTRTGRTRTHTHVARATVPQTVLHLLRRCLREILDAGHAIMLTLCGPSCPRQRAFFLPVS